MGNSFVLFDVSMEIFPRQLHLALTLGRSVTHKKLFPREQELVTQGLPKSKMECVTAIARDNDSIWAQIQMFANVISRDHEQ